MFPVTRLFLFDYKLSVTDVDRESIPGRRIVADDLFRGERFDVRLQISLQGSCAERRIVAVIDNELLCVVRKRQLQLLFLEPLRNAREEQIYDLIHILTRKRLVEYDLVEPVEEFRAEAAAEQRVYAVPRLIRYLPVPVNTVEYNIGAEVGREDYDRILRY